MPFIVLFVGLLVWVGPSWAQDERNAMTRETVLEWVGQYQDAQPEFTPGQTLGLSDMDKIRPFVPPGYFEEFQFPEVTFDISSPGDYPPRTDYLEATEKFTGQTQLAEDGGLKNYVAGQPFPADQLDPADPTAGLKIGWNFNFRWQHYGIKVGNFATIMIKPGGTHGALPGIPEDMIQPGGTVERVLQQRYQRVYHSHLAMLPEQNYTLPVDGAAEFEWKDINDFTDPYEMRGLRVLIQRSSDPHQPDQAWTYVPSLRKVRRVSAEEKADSFQGSDTTIDDFFGFSGRVLDYDWAFHGWKDVLHIMNSPVPMRTITGPQGGHRSGRGSYARPWWSSSSPSERIIPTAASFCLLTLRPIGSSPVWRSTRKDAVEGVGHAALLVRRRPTPAGNEYWRASRAVSWRHGR